MDALDASFASNLREAILRRNLFSAVPPSLLAAGTLTSLDLTANRIASVSPRLGELTNLTNLELSVNKVSSLPESISALTSLTSLVASDNVLTDIPNISVTFCPPRLTGQSLQRLQLLDVGNNRLTYVPPFLAAMEHLRGLVLDGNLIKTIPSWTRVLCRLMTQRSDSKGWRCCSGVYSRAKRGERFSRHCCGRDQEET
jgi:internalin A